MNTIPTAETQDPSAPTSIPTPTPTTDPKLKKLFTLSALALIAASAVVIATSVQRWQVALGERSQMRSQIAENIPPEPPVVMQTPDPTMTDPNLPNDRLENVLRLSLYSPPAASLLTAASNDQTTLHFVSTQINPDMHHNSFYITFPNTWTPMLYTNEQDRDDSGTNLILKKGNEIIRIKQQLYESGSCLFDPADVSGMAYLCNLVATLPAPHANWNIFSIDKTPGIPSPTWDRLAVCDQDIYALGVATYATPSAIDKRTCSPWTPVGEIDYLTPAVTEANRSEFQKIISSIRVESEN
ncbi:hypothetical protein KC921_03960 [Candidatus Woesebacteria bacterium]|nr:hypothetical protein [Candidatus Woesebacteria bacterium]